ncbi:MAG: CHASE2 domain-containing protein [Desulfobacca sp.]|uniref:CHASE2 domain-containing protein n=1 Tax=Desulfobacca sp. TaxID=2067990 RepID=UPI004049F5C1
MIQMAVQTVRARLRAAVVLLLLSLAITAALEASGVLASFTLKAQDQLHLRLPLQPAAPDILLITIDQADLEFFQEQGVGWPWPRELYVPLVDFCRRGKAVAVIFDLLFTESSVYGAADDQRLAQALARAGNVLLPIFLSQRSPANGSDPAAVLAKSRLPLQGTPTSSPQPYSAILTPIPPLLQAARGVGNVAASPDVDGTFRRLPLLLPFQDCWLPSLALAAFRLSRPPDAVWGFAAGVLRQGDVTIPLDRQGQLLLKFRDPSRSYRRLSAANVIQSEVRLQHGQEPIYPPDTVQDAWILVGATAPGLMDLKPSPLAPVFPGVELHATALDNLLQGDFLRAVPGWAVWLWTLVLVVAITVLVLWIPRLIVVTFGLLVGLGLHLLLSAVCFTQGWLIDPILPAVGLFLAFDLTTAYSYATTGRQKAALRKMFSHYMSEEVLQHLLEHPEKVCLGGERRYLTLFFSDLAGFTTISEGLAPERLVQLLNAYLSAMTDIILAEQGTVDKFEGDAIMAFWGAPLPQRDHALRACRAALAQQAALVDLNGQFAAQGWPPLACRIGLHTGEAVVGNLGSRKRFDYTVIGDTVNLASRLEGLNKFYGTNILASETTVQECQGLIEFLEVDWVAVKGREKPVAVYQVLARQGELPAAHAAAREAFAAGLDCYRQGQFGQAERFFQEALTQWPEHGPSQTFLRRCQTWQTQPPAADWDAVFRPESK